MNAIRRLVCRLVGHTTLPGVRREWSLYHYCPRCTQMAEGKLVRR